MWPIEVPCWSTGQEREGAAERICCVLTLTTPAVLVASQKGLSATCSNNEGEGQVSGVKFNFQIWVYFAHGSNWWVISPSLFWPMSFLAPVPPIFFQCTAAGGIDQWLCECLAASWGLSTTEIYWFTVGEWNGVGEALSCRACRAV